eukprot:COSAG02_NODE_868_length_16360_cov_12.608204_8_plen_1642_part_00
MFSLQVGSGSKSTATCVPCQPGSFDHDDDASTGCELCPRSTYQDSEGGNSCTLCPGGMVSPTGSVSPSNCTAQLLYVGCFEDRESFVDGRDLTGVRFSMGSDASLERCQELCAGWTYMGLQSIDQCFCDNTYGTYEELDLDPEGGLVCGPQGGACGQNNTAYPNDSCHLANAVFILPSWACVDVSCDAGTAAVQSSAELSMLGESEAHMQASCCDISCKAWNDAGNVCDEGTRFMTRLSETVVAGTGVSSDPQASCCTAPCAAGMWNNDGRCEPCAAGTISDGTIPDASECTECIAGQYAGPRSASCVSCAAGQYDHDQSATTSCENCAAGSYSAQIGAMSCDGECPGGSFGAAGAQSSGDCVACAAGQHDHDGDAATPCRLCLAGFFSETTGRSECVACPAGQAAIGGSVLCSSPVPSFAEAHCPVEWAACVLVSGCEEALSGAIAAPSHPTSGSEELLAALQCVLNVAEEPTLGCIDPSASNYDATKATSNSSCVYECGALTTDVTAEVATKQCYIFSTEHAAWEADPPLEREAQFWEELSAASHIIVQGAGPAIDTETYSHTIGDSNLAAGVSTSQSSEDTIIPGRTSDRAVDQVRNAAGNIATEEGEGSCTLTENAANQWWQADLGSTVLVDSVYIYHRTDCCQQRNAGASVFVSTTADYSAGEFCGIVQADGAGGAEIIDCDGKPGRFVTIQQDGYLEICEVEVYESVPVAAAVEDTNIALGAATSESSVWNGANCVQGGQCRNGEMTVDGSRNSWGDTAAAPCAATAGNTAGNAEWFQIDLGRSVAVSRLDLYPRTDCCQLQGGEIVWLSESPDYRTGTVCGTVRSDAWANFQASGYNADEVVPDPVTGERVSGFVVSIYCDAQSGRFVTIEREDGGMMQLCEAEVYPAAPAAKPMQPFPAQLDLVNQDLTLRYVRIEGREVFGGGGSNFGAVVSCKGSTLKAEYLEVTGNAQKGLGSGAIFSESSNVTIDGSVFDSNRNLGLGAGVLYASVGSTVAVVHTQFMGSTVKNEFNLNSPDDRFKSASVAVLVDSSMTVEASSFAENIGQSVIVATASTLTIVHTAFDGNADSSEQKTALQEEIDRRRLSEQVEAPSMQAATVSLWSGSVARLDQSRFTNNGGWSAGALFVANAGSSVRFDRVDFLSNQGISADSAAGALYLSDGATAEGTRSTFDGNWATSEFAAGAIYAKSATVTLSDAVFTANEARPHPTAGTRAGAGAVFSDRCAIRVSRATLSDNEASGGTDLTGANYADALQVLLPTSVAVVDSTFSPMNFEKTVAINPGSVAGVVQGGCNQNPCALGSSCSYANYSTTCTPCSGMTYSSNGISCQACPPGFGPRADQTICEPCRGNNHSTFGVCLPCPDSQVVVDDQKRCDVCPTMRQTAVAGSFSDQNRECGCADSFHNASQQLFVCFDGGYETGEYLAALAEHDSEVEAGQVCEQCPTDALGQACFDCEKGTAPTIAEGYTIPQLPGTIDSRRSLLQQAESSIQLAFRCHDEFDLAIIRCPAHPSTPGECSLGYQGYLCQTCADGYGMMPSRLCEPCAGTGFTTKSLLTLLAIIVVMTLVVGIGIKYWRKFPFKLAVRCAFQPMRIVITYAQVTSQLGDVLSFQYPPAFEAVVDAVRPVMDVCSRPLAI